MILLFCSSLVSLVFSNIFISISDEYDKLYILGINKKFPYFFESDQIQDLFISYIKLEPRLLLNKNDHLYFEKVGRNDNQDITILNLKTREWLFFKFSPLFKPLPHESTSDDNIDSVIHDSSNNNSNENGNNDRFVRFQIIINDAFRIKIDQKRLFCNSIKLVDFYRQTQKFKSFIINRTNTMPFPLKCIVTVDQVGQFNIEKLYKTISDHFPNEFYSMSLFEPDKIFLRFNQGIDKVKINLILLQNLNINSESIIVNNIPNRVLIVQKGFEGHLRYCNKEPLCQILKSDRSDENFKFGWYPGSSSSNSMEEKRIKLGFQANSRGYIIDILINQILFNRKMIDSYDFTLELSSYKSRHEDQFIIFSFFEPIIKIVDFLLSIKKIFDAFIMTRQNVESKIRKKEKNENKKGKKKKKKILEKSNKSSFDLYFAHLEISPLMVISDSEVIKIIEPIHVSCKLKTFQNLKPLLSIPFSGRNLNNQLEILSRLASFPKGSLDSINSWIIKIIETDQSKFNKLVQELSNILLFDRAVIRIGMFSSTELIGHVLFVDYISSSFNYESLEKMTGSLIDSKILAFGHFKQLPLLDLQKHFSLILNDFVKSATPNVDY